jgi:hypothetical protein
LFSLSNLFSYYLQIFFNLSYNILNSLSSFSFYYNYSLYLHVWDPLNYNDDTIHGEPPGYNNEKGLTLKLVDWPTNGKPGLLGITPIFGDLI